MRLGELLLPVWLLRHLFFRVPGTRGGICTLYQPARDLPQQVAAHDPSLRANKTFPNAPLQAPHAADPAGLGAIDLGWRAATDARYWRLNRRGIAYDRWLDLRNS